MLRKSTDLNALTITIDSEGTASLSGISYTDLRDLLTVATIYYQEHPPKIEAADDTATRQNNLDAFAAHMLMQHILDVLNIKLGRALNPDLVSGSTTRVRALYSYRVARLEELVAAAEALAAAEPTTSVRAATETIEKAVREVTQALLVLKRHT